MGWSLGEALRPVVLGCNPASSRSPSRGEGSLCTQLWEKQVGLTHPGIFLNTCSGLAAGLGRAPYPPKVHNREDFTSGARYLQDERVSSGSCVPSSKMLYCQRDRAGLGGSVEEWGGGVAGKGCAHRCGQGGEGEGSQLEVGAPGTHWQAVALVPSPVCCFQLLCRLSETSFAQTLPGQSQHFSLLSGPRPPGVRRRYWLRGGRECGQGQGLQQSPLNLVENRPGRGALSSGGKKIL